MPGDSTRPEGSGRPHGGRPAWGLFLVALLCWAVPSAAQGPSAFSETYGDWRVACAVDPGEEGAARETPPAPRCVLEQHIDWRESESGQARRLAVATLSAPASDGQVDAVFSVPFGLLLSGGLRLSVDKGEAFAHLPFYICLSGGCVVQGRLDGEAVRLLEHGRILVLEMVSTGGQPFRVEMSLSGFTAAFARLREVAAR